MSKKSRRVIPSEGYLLLLVGILIGFLLFTLIAAVFSVRALKNLIPMEKVLVLRVLYTSEKQSWMEEVVPLFEKYFKDNYGYTVKVESTIAGSHETVNLILHGSSKPVVWSPASSIWIPYLNYKWRKIGYNYDIVGEWHPVLITPTVIITWKSFLEKYNITDFLSLYKLIKEGVEFNYGHPDPMLSNGGVTAVLLEIAEASGKPVEKLTLKDLVNTTVQEIVRTIESRVIYYGKSTGFFGRWAVENGPSALAVFSAYENIVIDNSDEAFKRWGDRLVAVYPSYGTILNDHPFAILNAPWVSEDEKLVAEKFIEYLLSKESQERAVKHGFRPVREDIALSHEVFSPENGVSYSLNVTVHMPPSGEVLEGLFTIWVKLRGRG
jgi:Ca-activated chloride channel family protein